MTDEELAIALYAEGLRPKEIAKKLETTIRQVQIWARIAGGRPRVIEKAVLSTMVDGMDCKQMASAAGIKPHNMKTYACRLVRSGTLKRELREGVWIYRRA